MTKITRLGREIRRVERMCEAAPRREMRLLERLGHLQDELMWAKAARAQKKYGP